jgi:hypothetical protein
MANLKRKVFSVQGKLNASMVLDVGYIFGSIFGMMLQLQKENEAISSYRAFILQKRKLQDVQEYKKRRKKDNMEKYILVYHEMK